MSSLCVASRKSVVRRGDADPARRRPSGCMLAWSAQILWTPRSALWLLFPRSADSRWLGGRGDSARTASSSRAFGSHFSPRERPCLTLERKTDGDRKQITIRPCKDQRHMGEYVPFLSLLLKCLLGIDFA